MAAVLIDEVVVSTFEALVEVLAGARAAGVGRAVLEATVDAVVGLEGTLFEAAVAVAEDFAAAVDGLNAGAVVIFEEVGLARVVDFEAKTFAGVAVAVDGLEAGVVCLTVLLKENTKL